MSGDADRGGLAGWQGAMQLLDRDSGKLILQVFDSKQNVEAAEPTFETMPQQLGPEIQKNGRRQAINRQARDHGCPRKPGPRQVDRRGESVRGRAHRRGGENPEESD